jgi:hypothetical protein
MSLEGTTSSVEADVDGTPIWFRSDDLRLRASPEAFGSALLVAAVQQRRRLRLADRVDPVWLRGARAVPAVVGSWWGSPDLPPAARAQRPPDRPPVTGTGLCFTCGVDSFHALDASGLTPDLLVFAAGYDIPLDDRTRLADVIARIRHVAEARQIDAAVISTNLRSHPSFAPVNWERTHGGALAALGHLLDRRIGTLALASSFTVEHARPWGSRWDLDPLWSSTSMQVRHVGHDRRREEKIADLGEDELVWRHLQVCWEHRSSVGNCGRCDKCLVTAVGIAAADRHVDGFPGDNELIDAIGSLPNTRYANSYRRMLEGDVLPPYLRDAARSLLTRST